MNFVGSKAGAGVPQQIISQLPPHSIFVELFAGTAVISRIKKLAMVSILVDVDPQAPGLVNPPAGVAVKNVCYRVWCQEHLHQLAPDALIYADPPYLRETRSCKRDYYRHELATPEEHLEILGWLKSARCRVVISGYWSQLYADTLTGWRTHTIPTVNRAGERTTEWLWMNYPEPVALHDCRFVGRNRTDRQRIKRKAVRWRDRLLAMPLHERAAVVDAVDCARCSTISG